MSTEFKLYNVKKEDMYSSKSIEEKNDIRRKMVEEAKIRGVKPTARKYNTYPATVRRWIKRFKEENNIDNHSAN